MKEEMARSATGAIAREEKCCVLYLHVADGVTPEQGYAIRDTLNDAETNGWWFLNPGAIVIVFSLTKSGRERLASCQAALAKLVATHGSWPAIGAGVAEGVIFGAFTSAGILEAMPAGPVISAAMKRAIANAS